ncbi:hypothetical protein EXIGLDRAFT_744468 [Exidia glandulosa HHB12029]|uniref:Uncharacterized protein n=1 Tax=Exidia glandulosa HHB12029 TaxID=1314781 RepID=A0A165PSD6_EXIGL|nr:hypothetical protein EXIGLDRAFT_744468 [Exidia glandulosa HHB12029]
MSAPVTHKSSHRGCTQGAGQRVNTVATTPFDFALLPVYGQSAGKPAYYRPRSHLKALEQHVLKMEDRLRTLGVDVPDMQRVGSSAGLKGRSAAALVSDLEEQIESLQVEIEELEQDNRDLRSVQHPQPSYSLPPSMPQACYSYPSKLYSAPYSRMG